MRLLLICVSVLDADGAPVPGGDGAGSFSEGWSCAALAVASHGTPGLLLCAKFLPTCLLDSRHKVSGREKTQGKVYPH
ncbi:hypothetical protein AV530_006673 [Patagioenas fasciata monilis]|uniref:Uncharacterized protein n=1 Tax=Patagioenas fasciata monilis TaxID=372326 RepID=A0A1V4KQ23_PATFA|nr:hypothetical protein AV530_006673 [Patagioenas fasciata monilis]